jgi:peptide/nickel transport system permease protein
MGLLGVVLTLVIVVSGIFVDQLMPHSPTAIDVSQRFQGSSWIHPLGTDQLGRDILSRVIAGSRIALTVAFSAIGLAMLGGLILGMLAGYGGRWLDNILLFAFDTISSFPYIMLALAVVALYGSSLLVIVVVIALTTLPSYGRLVRTLTLSLKNAEFVVAERSMGASSGRIMIRHILPNIVGPLFIIVSMDIPVVVTVEAGLSFLGLGVPPPAPSWGRLLFDGYLFVQQTPWIAIGGGLPLIVTTLGFTFLGEALRDVVDPKLRKQI